MKGYMQELQEKVGYNQTLGSTEEFLAYLTQFNQYVNQNSDNSENVFIASMDVESLYTSLQVGPTSDAIKETILNSQINVLGVNYKEIGIFLRKHMSSENIEGSIFKKFIPLKKKKVKKDKGEFESDLWIFPEETPCQNVIKHMFAEAVHVSVKILMNIYVYV